MRRGRPLWLVGLVLVSGGCPDRVAPTPSRIEPIGPLTRELLAFGEQARLDLQLEVPDAAATRRRLVGLVGRVRRALEGEKLVGGAAVVRINRLLFGELGYRREVHDRSPELMLLSRILERRRGSCVGLGALYLALGEATGLPIRGVLVPGHFFVRLDPAKGRRLGIELLKRGRAMPAAWYRRKYRVPDRNPTYLAQSLTASQSLAVFRYNLANEYRLRGQYRRARAAYEAVLEQLPRFAEARASLGLVHQLQGHRALALRAYVQARKDNPKIQGLDQNLEALDQRLEASSKR